MLRDIDEKWIRPEALLQASDMAKLGCGNCKDCSECCRDRAEMITLDAFDVKLLKEGLNYSLEGMLEQGLLVWSVIDDVVLPCLAKKEGEDACIFLDAQGRCSIHAFRPGICRMFPLARLYHEDGSFSYFMQEGECPRNNGVKIKVSRWLGYPDVRSYEQAVRTYHDALTALRKNCRETISREEKVSLQRAFLEYWFVNSPPGI